MFVIVINNKIVYIFLFRKYLKIYQETVLKIAWNTLNKSTLFINLSIYGLKGMCDSTATS